MMVYKGYVGVVEYDDDAKILSGTIVGIRDVVTFQAERAADVEAEFRASVDDYLAFCKESGDPPNKPASGKFLVRLPPETHRRLAMLAEADGMSLNALVESLLTADLEQRLQCHADDPASRDPARPSAGKPPRTATRSGRRKLQTA